MPAAKAGSAAVDAALPTSGRRADGSDPGGSVTTPRRHPIQRTCHRKATPRRLRASRGTPSFVDQPHRSLRPSACVGTILDIL
ncbi:hypothetical protein ONE63_002206 [Megalurothrips usitatus]|uniref:Uncharacterized protein n=1 Tax=Megalurothrips usitatus TaxID=439358 RepID=A0AAV7X7G0_9NEOP|nr:hypothetical protein ONE63_002206 [Megalurothrips usitatus]